MGPSSTDLGQRTACLVHGCLDEGSERSGGRPCGQQAWQGTQTELSGPLLLEEARESEDPPLSGPTEPAELRIGSQTCQTDCSAEDIAAQERQLTHSLR